MATILYVATHGSDDPTRAVLPFVLALGTVAGGNSAQIALLGESTYLMKDYVAAETKGVGFPAMHELWPKVIAGGIRVYV
jgi:predicted peroxiredoxin